MSDCRVPMPFYQPPDVVEYDQRHPIRGRFVFASGRVKPFSMPRFMNGSEQFIDHIEIDGDVFVRRCHHREEDLDWMSD